MKRYVTVLLSVLLFLLIWVIISWRINNPALFPPLEDMFKQFGYLLVSHEFYISLGVTIGRGVLGMLISLVCAFLVSVCFARVNFLYQVFQPFLAAMRSIPVISFILFALIFLNPESIPLLIGFLTMFPVLVGNLTQGILNIRPELTEMGRLFQLPLFSRFIHIVYPQLKPHLFSGLATAMGFGWRAIIMGEVLSQCAHGIGTQMKKAQLFIDIPELLLWTIVAIIVSFVFDRGIRYMESIIFPLYFVKYSLKKQYRESNPVNVMDISYKYGDVSVFDHTTMTFPAGKITGIQAPSGAGKTTLLLLIARFLTPLKGRVDSPERVSFVFQEPWLLQHLSVRENVLLPLTTSFSLPDAVSLVEKVLSDLEISELSERYPNELSYGQQQRVSIARALVFPAGLLIMDEPFKGLDEALTLRLIERIKMYQAENEQTVLFSSHNPEELYSLADQIVTL